MINTYMEKVTIMSDATILENQDHARTRGPYKIFKDEIYALYRQGWAVWQISRKMNIARRSVMRVLREQDQVNGEVF